MAVGKLTIVPETIRNLPPSSLDNAKLFVGVFIQENEKHRTHSEPGPQPYWRDTLISNVPEGENTLTVELVNENSGLIGYTKFNLSQVFEQGHVSPWVQLISTSGQPLGELKLNLTFNGTLSFSTQQTSYQYESRQSSYSSLGPASAIPENYGAGSPPPFHPPPPVANYSTINNSMPTASTGLVNSEGIVDPEKMTRSEFEEAKEKGSIPTWAKYGGGALAGVAALGLAAWGAHEVKDHLDDKKKKDDNKSFISQAYQQFQQVSHQQSFGKPEKKKDKKQKKEKKDKHKKSKKSGSDSSSSDSSSDSD